jgi:hypothetical protein
LVSLDSGSWLAGCDDHRWSNLLLSQRDKTDNMGYLKHLEIVNVVYNFDSMGQGKIILLGLLLHDQDSQMWATSLVCIVQYMYSGN